MKKTKHFRNITHDYTAADHPEIIDGRTPLIHFILAKAKFTEEIFYQRNPEKGGYRLARLS